MALAALDELTDDHRHRVLVVQLGDASPTWTATAIWTSFPHLNGDDKIAWYENIDGEGSFGPQQVITSEAAWARSVTVGDLDGDGDFDVLSASSYDDTIAWYENTDGKAALDRSR